MTNVIVYICFPLRTAASVHIAKWSPDGEYFATVGKVYDSCEHVAKLNIGTVFLILRSMLVFVMIPFACLC